MGHTWILILHESKMKAKMPTFSPVLGNSCAQVSQCFSAKAVQAPVTG
jgi:hypothetical protein